MTQSPRAVVCALYHFVPLPDYAALRQPLLELMQHWRVRGTLLLAPEGINGTVAGSREGIDALLAWLKADARFADLDHKESFDEAPPFLRSKVKLKKEIVTMGVEGLDPRHKAGTHVAPRDWNRLLADPELLLIDTRNQYEVEVGTFRGAVNPGTASFREFPDFVKSTLDPARHRKVAMFCTGGIRCEKSTAYLKEQGFEEVYHLKGGILKYLEEVPEEESLWEGECFVFDNRVAVNHSLEKGAWDQCHACRMPVSEADKASPHYEQGVSCPRCHEDKDDTIRAQYRERQRQLELARARGDAHLGADATDTLVRRKALKQEARAANARRSAGQRVPPTAEQC